MSAIYFHIPFCEQRCTYCDFYTEIAPKYVGHTIGAMATELKERRYYLPSNELINTIYFGGGTPSLLNADQFRLLLDTAYSEFRIAGGAEITFEANPDDLTTVFFESIKHLPFNRISIGIQSFDNEDLKRINRRHNAQQALDAVRNAQNAGFSNISIDLIYGLPGQTLEKWERQLEQAFLLDVQHISAYGLTYEDGTVLWKQLQQQIVKAVDEDTMNNMYEMLLVKMEQNHFEAYEISNFAKVGFRSRHNSSYWNGTPYLGIGPAAHSYDGSSRQWNISSIKLYLDAIANAKPYFECEKLSLNDAYNDYIMVSLRTSEGIDINHINHNFGSKYADYCLESLKTFTNNKKIYKTGDNYRLSTAGILISNQIIMELIKV